MEKININKKEEFDKKLLKLIFANEKNDLYFYEDIDEYKKKYNILINALIKNKAIISGGAILKTINNENWNTTDVDVYINSDNLYSFFEDIKSIFIEIANLTTALPYDSSFFFKNNIKFRFNLNINKYFDGLYKNTLDIIVVNSNTNVIDVVKNFDLSVL